MRLDNEFVVPRPIDQAWAVLTNLERIAPCVPGAQLTAINDDDHHGTVRVKVGPVVAQYSGVARFRELDATGHHAVLEARGKERNGRGMASALVTADLIDEGEQTRVRVGTDLTISGPLAQFGRGAITDVSGRLLGQFVDRLRATVLAEPVPPVDSVPADPAPPAPPETTTPGGHGAAPITDPPGAAATEPGAAPADLLRVAALPILKRVGPLALAVAMVIIVIVLLAR